MSQDTCTRWVSVCVDVFSHEMFEGDTYSKREAWLWLVANASWKDRRVNHKGKLIELKRGDVLVARSFLAKTWGWSEQNVRTFLAKLVSEDMLKINQSNGHLANIATICNYSAYQSAKQEVNQSTNQCLTSAQPEGNHTVQGNTILCERNTREREDAQPKTDVVEIDDTIRHRDFSISLKAIQMQLMGVVPMEAIRQVATGHALQWATDIAAGKRNVVPSNTASFIRASIQHQRNHDAVTEARKAAAKSPRASSAAVVEFRPDPSTPRNLRPREEAKAC